MAAIVINEIHYNSPGAPDVEYVELINTGAAPQDLSGWYLLDDDNLHPKCFLSGTIAPGEYLVIAGLLSLFNSTYPGVANLNPNPFDSPTPGAGFSLGNGGDTVRVFNGAGALMDSVQYSDTSPWPTASDGGGPSLELINPALDNSLPASWAASVDPPPQGTPGSQNSVFEPDTAPLIASVKRDVPLPTAADAVSVTAEVTDDSALTAVMLHVDPGTGFVAQPMFDDGLHADGGAGDGIWGATISPRPSGTLVRYYLSAQDDLGQIATEPVAAPASYRAYTVDYRPPPLRISEIVASNQNGIADELGQKDDWLEIHNRGPAPATLTGMFLTDDRDETLKWAIPAVTIPPGGYLLVWCDSGSGVTPFHANFNLAKSGGVIDLYETVDHGNVRIHGMRYGLQNTDMSFGYAPDDADAPEYLSVPTPAATNDAVPPSSPVCINEFLAASQIGVEDWVELHNRAVAAINIGGWCLSDDATLPGKYAFPPGTTIPGGGFLAVNASTLGFGLELDGGEVLLLTSETCSIGRDYFDFHAQFPDISQGRFPDGTPNWHFFSSWSFAGPNDCGVGGVEPDPLQALLFHSPTELRWSAAIGATGYDVVRGDLGVLLGAGGDFAAAVTECLENDGSDTASYASAIPSPGAGFFYLARGVTSACGFGSYDSGASAQAGSRDAEIEAAPPACP